MPKRGIKLLLLGAASLVVLAFFAYQSGVLAMDHAERKAVDLDSFPVKTPTIKYGLVIDTFHIVRDTFGRNQFLGDLLHDAGIDHLDIARLARNAREVYDVRKIREGRPFLLFYADTSRRPEYFIYEPSDYQYVVYELKDSMRVRLADRPVEKRTRTFEGEIVTNLWDAIVGQGMDWDLAVKMEDALQWSVSFHHVQPGDRFRMVFEEDRIDGRTVGVGRLWVAVFQNEKHDYHAVYFDHEKHGGYYDLEGRPMEAPFLRAPVRYTRISSRYNPRRYHPILKRVRPHYGTDYAAPYGTPIYAVGNGTVVEAGYTKGNGNYVKIRHDKTYTTQYLHMQGFARGIRSGVPVKQGEVIGYVGSTGLATGPHVCFRFWKNGRQVNHLNLSFPPPDPLPETELPNFFRTRDHYLAMINTMVPEKPEERTNASPKKAGESRLEQAGNP